jgi:hypothetical protein
MADNFTVEATNGPAFAAALDQITAGLANLGGPLEAAARELVAASAASAPRLSGRLAGSHRALPGSAKSVRVTVDTPYAAVQHWGWPGHGIHRKPWVVATWLRNPAPLDKLTDSIQKNIDKAAAST